MNRPRASASTHVERRISMKLSIAWVAFLSTSLAMAETVNFDQDPLGQAPAGLSCGVTGSGSPRWTVESEPGVAASPRVLTQSGVGDFPWCVRPGSAMQDGFVEVRFKPLRGRQDQAGGVVWRWKDGQTYYVARANALEDNVSLYVTQGGRRSTLKYVDAPVEANAWHLLRVESKGSRIDVALDGKLAISFDDGHITGPGSVGVWTKSDSVTAFKDFSFGSAAKP